MPRRTEVFTLLPWTGGINAAVDPGVIPPSDLQQADHVVFSSSGARIKREGWDYFDTAIPQVIARFSSGTTRSLLLSDTCNSGTDQILVNGEEITITGDANYAAEGAVVTLGTYTSGPSSFSDLDVSVGLGGDHTITSLAHGLYTGQQVTLSTTGTLPVGFSPGDYYAVVVDANTFKLAATLADAIAVPAIPVPLVSASGGGTHTVTPVVISNNQISYTAAGSYSESLTSTIAEAVTRTWAYIGVQEFWYSQGGAKVQRIVAVSGQPKLFYFTNEGKRFEIAKDATATALGTGSNAPTRVSFEVMFDTLLMAFDKATNTVKYWQPWAADTDWFDVSSIAPGVPNASIIRKHLGRIFANDKDDPDRIHYSSPGNPLEWGGVGDSGAIDIFPGDGDATGIISISPSFKGRLFVSKRSRMIDLQGDSPENFRPVPFTEGLGAIAQNGFGPVDLDDLLFVSDRGIHSIAATDAQGDFKGAYLSAKIQPTFATWSKPLLETSQALYLPALNSVVFSIAEENATAGSSLWLWNAQLNEWYRWPNLNPVALTSFRQGRGLTRLLISQAGGRLLLAQNGTRIDFGTSPIAYTIKSGAIYPDGNPQTLKMFKRLSLYFKPKGDVTFNITYQIDNQVGAATTITASSALTTYLLGTTLVLGSSTLGLSGALAPLTVPIEGVGRGITLTISTSGIDENVELYGMAIEYESADINQETL